MSSVGAQELSGRGRWGALVRTRTARVLAIYGVSRIVAMAAFWFSWTRFDRQGYPIPDDASFLEFLSRAWDGHWYGVIAEDGYPDGLPVDADGQTQYSPWAFFPLFPLLARVIMAITRLPWEVVGPALSTAFGAVAMLLLVKLICAAAPALVQERPALPYTAVAALSFFPSAGAFSMAYSDSLALVLILCTLLSIHRRQYLLAVLPVLALGFTRAVALPMAAVVIWHLIGRCRSEGVRSISASQWWAAIALCVAAVFSGFSWMIVTGIALGSPDAYLQAQSAWRTGPISTAPFAGWTWFLSGFGWILFALLCVAIVWATFSSFVRRLGPELQAWGGAYVGFLVAASAFGASTPRYLLLSIVFLIALVPAKRGFRGDLNVIVTYGVLMVGWIYGICMVKGFTA